MCEEKDLKNHSENVLESPCPKTAPLPPNSAASLIIRHGCHTISREQGLWKAQYLPSRCKKWGSKVVPTSICAVYRGDAACAMCSAEQPQNQLGFSPSLPNLEHIGFLSFKSVFLLQGFCHCVDYVWQRWRHKGLNLSQESDKLEHVYVEVYEFTFCPSENTLHVP